MIRNSYGFSNQQFDAGKYEIFVEVTVEVFRYGGAVLLENVEDKPQFMKEFLSASFNAKYSKSYYAMPISGDGFWNISNGLQ